MQVSWGHARIFRIVPPANTLVRWVNEKRLRPHSAGSTLPHLWPTCSSSGWPPRLQPDTSPHALRIPDRSGHPALRDIPSSWLQVRLGRVRLSPSCPFRLLHTRLLSRPARNYPRFRIQRSSSERRGDFNPPDSRAAQRTLCPFLTSTNALVPIGFDQSVPFRAQKHQPQAGAADPKLRQR